MDVFFTNRYYRMNRRFLLIIGIWPYNDTRNSQVRRILVYAGFTLIILPQILSVATSDLSLESIIEALSCLIPSVCILISYVTAYCHNKMILMLEHIKFDWYNLNAGQEREIIGKYANLLRMCTMFAFVLFTVNVVSYILPATLTYFLEVFVPLNETRINELPIKVELFIDQQKHFLFILILAYVSCFVVIVTSVGTYLTYAAYMMHACGMLEVVGYMLRHLFDTGKYNLSTTKEMENIMSRLIRCIFFHERTKRYIHAMNSIYKLTVLIHLLLAFLTICLGFIRVFYLKNITENMKESIMVISYISYLFIWLFLYASIGQLILNKSRNLADNAYATSWYMVPHKMQKLLLMVLTNITRYPSLEIGGIFEVSYNLFLSVIRSAMSYAMVLHSLR